MTANRDVADNEADYKISGSRIPSNDFGIRWNRSHPVTNPRIDGASDGDRANSDNQSGVADRDNDWPLPHQERSVSYEQNGYAGEIPFRTLKSPDEDYITKHSDESSDDDEGEGERKCPSSRLRSSSVLQDARYSARPAATESPTLSPSSGNIQAGNTVPHGDPLFMADTGISSSDQSLQKAETHAIQDSIVEPRRSQRSEPASDQGEYSPLRGASNGGDNYCHKDDNGYGSHDRRNAHQLSSTDDSPEAFIVSPVWNS
ncbi:hypothetical protein BDV95DRAFT_123927 [Massariosphaeria phaeospora]|uniref:Uncharacterized protein n=1 Tax=Massariosphaeria phaeospora TaxID=100035 RepID=A0A7C8MJS3_9PLEO|nr:hypothetical protein BDV95DRAFT_123927 [Massariosphaeria phaeospora]